ncbi:beta-ketoacyl-[acyl-carrier-protein] synthase family protein [Dysgonomonas sp. Marseille-P4677]|uniref:beta-ketoacyl-[acyl-carrier-protein] synthase family protein n=1 Tax=Dysgonomonas sp. Marseille-P4677 TaxID=2364790 RepID=UPI0019113AC5|nr:beta-ketoacyl-[acyl-carrier-protein] synthase family protein [Dysgonomonas sp. Marseille-P4677]MBK5720098.1 beta-ketoacyl-[acyl-carrier-protein] synthase family protein [Dysgonomonas sp. Marseille-P4677]
MQIYITGIGIVSGIGINVEENLHAIRDNKHGMEKVSLFPSSIDVPVCEVKYTNTQLTELLSLSTHKTYSRTALLGILAAKEALNDSKIDINAQRIGFISSTSVGGMDLSENFYVDFKEDQTKGRLRNIIHHDCGDSTEIIASYLGIADFVTTISTACSSAANAIILGARMIKNGLLDAVIVGGTDALCKFTLNGFNSLMILDKGHCKPFDHAREGLNLGEGAGYLVLQSDKTLKKEPYCTLSGYANANDAFHQTATSSEGNGPYLCMKEAIKMANILPEHVDYINVHGTGTPNNDLSEGKAIMRIFGDNIPKFSSVKPFIGHTLGASEGIEAALSVLSVYKGLVYPNLNFKEPIENTPLIPVSRWDSGLSIKHVLSNSFGFGGNDSSLLFSAIDKK